MKIRGSIIGFVVIVAVLVALVLWYGKRQPVETNVAPVVTGQTDVEGSSSTTANSSQSESPVQNDQAALPKNILQGNDANIAFYGHLEDQSGSPVSGAAIHFSILYKKVNGRGIQRGQVLSDINGFFTISGFSGDRLTIIPRKPGYALATTNVIFLYTQGSPGYFVPNANSPTVIQMRQVLQLQ